jgi:Ca2+-binding RTX toxin-like protein
MIDVTGGCKKDGGAVHRGLALGLAVVLALAGAPPARAVGIQTEVAFQANTGDLWSWKVPYGGSNRGLGMAAGTSPSIDHVLLICCDLASHEIAFQANSGFLGTVDSLGYHNLGGQMWPGTSPSLFGGTGAFNGSTGRLYGWDFFNQLTTFRLADALWPGSSPSSAGPGLIAFADSFDGDLRVTDARYVQNLVTQDMKRGTNPSRAAADRVAYHGNGGNVWVAKLIDPPADNGGDYDAGLGGTEDQLIAMADGTDPSINEGGDLAVQGSDNKLWVKLGGNPIQTGALMKEGTSPSIDYRGDVAFQGQNGNLWLWLAPADRSGDDPTQKGTASDLGLGMMAGTSPSISRDATGNRLTATASGSSSDDTLEGGSSHDLLLGLGGDDVIRGGRGNDVLYGGPGDDVINGGRGNDYIHDGPGRDRIVDHGGRTRVTLHSGTNRIDVRDGRGDDRVICARGTRNRIRSDRGDRIGRACRRAR